MKPAQLIVCLRSHADWHIQDPLSLMVQRLHGFFSVRCDCIDYFVLEELAYMLYLIDPHLQRKPELDYIA